MNITAKSRYGLKVLLDLWFHQSDGLQQRHNIAERQGIPVDFMDHILASLRDAGYVESIRGRKGGFKLGQNVENISLWHIIKAVEDNPHSIKCVASQCSAQNHCISFDAWSQVFSEVETIFKSKKLVDLISDLKNKNFKISEERYETIGC